jgi:MerR family transcriptional regulator, Zn(II)-responsive regulator of zntA
MFQVTQLARQCNVSTDAIRYYTRLGLLHPTRNPANSYRLYDTLDMKRLNFIHRAKHLGFSLHEIAQIFEDCNNGESPCPHVRKIIQHRIEENRKRIEQEMELQERMEHAMAQWKDMPDKDPNSDKICTLIESFTK